MLHCLSCEKIVFVQDRVAEGDGEPAVFPNAGVERSALGCLRHVTEYMLVAVEILCGVIRDVLVSGDLLRSVLRGCAVFRMPRLLSLWR